MAVKFRPSQAVLVGPSQRRAHVIKDAPGPFVEVRFLDGRRDLVEFRELVAVEPFIFNPGPQVDMFPAWMGTDTEHLERIPRVLSYGGGVDSFCMLVSSVELGEKPDRIVFMDVGDPGDASGERTMPAEWPETYEHILEVAAPYARKHGIPFHWIISGMPRGRLLKAMKDAGVIIEVYPIRPPKTERAKVQRASKSLFEYFLLQQTVPTKANRICTEVAKIERFDEWLGNAYPGQDVEVWIGFEKGEEYRQDRGKSYQVSPLGARAVARHMRFPLIEQDLDREDCIDLIQRSKLRVPHKSACVFCPFGKPEEWVDFFQRYPGIFQMVEDLWEGKPKTGQGYKLAQVFAKFELTSAQYRLMQKLARSPKKRDAFSGAELASFDSMNRKKWITKAGKLTKDGRAIYNEARKDPPWPSSRAGATSHNKAIVQRAAAGKPKVDVHYDRKTLTEWVKREQDKILTCEEEPDVPLERLRTRRRVKAQARTGAPVFTLAQLEDANVSGRLPRGWVLVKSGSHRASRYVSQTLGYSPKGLGSFRKRRSAATSFFVLPESEFAKIANIKGVSKARFRKDDAWFLQWDRLTK